VSENLSASKSNSLPFSSSLYIDPAPLPLLPHLVLQTRFFVALYGADVKKFYSYRKALLVQEGKDRVRVATAAY
jgi:hypothetical protein